MSSQIPTESRKANIATEKFQNNTSVQEALQLMQASTSVAVKQSTLLKRVKSEDEELLAQASPSAEAILVADAGNVTGTSADAGGASTTTDGGGMQSTSSATMGTAAATAAAAPTMAGLLPLTLGALGLGALAWDRSGSSEGGNSQPRDTTPPTLTISAISGGYVNNAKDDAAVTFSGTTNAEDGQKVTVTLNGKTYEASVASGAWSVDAPLADIQALTEGTLTVKADVSDKAGNAATQASQDFVYDKTAPTVAITDNEAKATSNIADASTTFTFTFSEDIADGSFTLDDVTVSGGTAGTLTKVDAKSYTLEVTPSAGVEAGSISVSTNAKGVTDIAGNAGVDATQTQAQGYDTKAATVAITDNEAKATSNIADASTTFTFTFSEDIADGSFTLDDVTVSGGTAGTLTKVDAKSYTLEVTPNAGLEAGSISVSTNAKGVTDSAGNAGVDAMQTQAQGYDIQTPKLELSATVALFDTNQIILTYDSSLDTGIADPLNLAISGFTVTMTGSSNPVTAIAVSGSTLTLTLQNAIVAGMLQVDYSDPTSGDDAIAVQDLAGNDAASVNFTRGIVADGYVRGAQIYIDTNGDGVADASEKLAGVITDANGNFFLPSTAPQGAIIAVGGVNIDTGLPMTTPLKAPAGSTTVNPLTTLVQAVVETSGNTVSAADAAATVADSLGLTLPNGTTLTSYDPLADTGSDLQAQAQALAAQKAAAQIVAITEFVAAGDAAAGASVISAMANQITTSTTPVNLTDSSTLSAIVSTATTEIQSVNSNFTVSAEAQSNLADAVSAIGNASNISGIAAVQSQFLDTIAPDAPSLSVAALTNDTTPLVRINFDTSNLQGKAAVVGDQLVLLDGGVQIDAGTLDADDISNGYVEFDTPTLAAGTHTFSAKLIDSAGNASAASTSVTTVVDTRGPTVTLQTSSDALTVGQTATLTLTFSEAVTGFSSSDIAISGGMLGTLSAPTTLSDGSVAYTITYTAPATGSAGQMSIAAGSYADQAGNQGVASNTIDLAIANPPVVQINQIGGNDAVVSTQTSDNIVGGIGEANLEVTVKEGRTVLGTTAADGNGIWSYALTSDNLSTLGQGDKTINASQTRGDATGSSTDFAFKIDTAAPAVSVQPVSGDGAINSAEKTTGVTIVGTAEAGATVKLAFGSGVSHVFTANEQGDWSLTLSAADYKAMEQGAETLVVSATDQAGNTASASQISFNIDTVAPTLTPFALATGSDSGIKGDGLTSIKTPVVQFTATSGSTVQVLKGETVLGDAVENGTTGQFNYTFLAGQLGEGGNAISIRALDSAGNQTMRSGTLTLDTVAPTIGSGATAQTIAENSGAGQLVYTAKASDTNAVGFSLKSGADASAFSIDSKTGAVKLTGSPEYETKASYAFTVVATDAAGNATEQAVTLAINNLDEVAPTIDSGDTAAAIDENSGAGQVVYQATSTDTDDVSDGVSYRLKPDNQDDAAAFSIDTSTGDVTLIGDPDHEVQSSYAFTVVATDAAGNQAEQAVTLAVKDVNEAPTAVALDQVTSSLAENSSTTSHVKVADIVITDDALGDNTVTLSGADASRFEIDGGALYIKSGTVLDYESQSHYEVTVNVADSTLAGSTPVTDSYTLTINDVNEAPVLAKDFVVGVDDKITLVNGQSVPTDASLGIDFTDPDTDPENNTLTFSISAGTPPPGLVMDDMGHVSGTPTQDGSYQFTVRASDGELTYDQSYTITVVSAPAIASFSITDASGNAALGQQGDALTFTVTLSEAATVSGGSPTITFKVGSGETVVASYASGSGSKELTFTATAPAGDGTFTLESIDLNGASVIGENTQQSLATSAIGQGYGGYRLDNTAPAKPTIDAIAVDDKINEAEALAFETAGGITLSGTAEAGSSVTIVGSELSTTTNQDGVWTLALTIDQIDALTNGFVEGAHSFSVTATDALGHVSEATTKDFLIDTVAPAAATIVVDKLLGATEVGSAVALTVMPAADATVQSVKFNGSTLSAAQGGGYSFDASGLSDGNYTVQVDTADAAGNVTTTTETVVVDTLAPNQPHIVSITDNSGSTSDHTTNDTTPTLAITAEAGATIRLQHWDGTWIDSTQYSVSESTPGNYSLTMTQAGIADKSYKLFAEDAAGNLSAVPGSGSDPTFRIDNLAPTAPSLNSNSDGNLTKLELLAGVQVTVSLTGTGADVNGKLDLLIDGQIDQTVTLTQQDISNGQYVFTLQPTEQDFTDGNVPEGAHALTARVTDKAGNAGAVSAPLNFSIDTVAPNQPHIVSITDNSGSTSDHTTNDTTPTLAITAEAGATIRLQHWDGSWVDPTQYSVSESTPGNYSLTMDQTGIANKSYKLFVQDAAGNLSAVPGSGSDPTFRIDNEAPTASTPTITDNLLSRQELLSGFDVTVNLVGTGADVNSTLTLLTNGEVDQTVTLTQQDIDNRKYVFTLQADESDFTGTPPNVTDGTYAFSAQLIDKAGNNGTTSAALDVTVDLTAPTVSSITLSDAALKIGETSTVIVTFSETVTGFDKNDVSVESGSVGEFSSTDGGKTWTALFTPTTGTEDATNVVSVGADYSDLAGNAGSGRSSDNYSVDTLAPTLLGAVGTGSTISLNYSEALDADNLPNTGAFSVMAGSTVKTVSAVAVSGSTVTLTLDSVLGSSDIVTLGYNDPSGSDDLEAIQDAAGNDGPSFANQTVPVLVAPELAASVLDNVSNLDVTSNLVLNYSESVSAVAGKYLHIVNDGGTGFHDENTKNTLDILVTDTSQVAISGGKITINPSADLDLANNYHVTVDAGAFIGASSQLATAAFDGTTALNFSTVTPGTSTLANAAQSQAMDASGALVDSYKWLDIENIGSPSASAGTALDLSGGKIALVAKDYDPAGGNKTDGYDGVGTGDFYVGANNFGADDLLYIDNQSLNANDLSLAGFVDYGTPPTVLQFASGTGGLGSFVDISLAGSSATFDSLESMKLALQSSSQPVISA